MDLNLQLVATTLFFAAAAIGFATVRGVVVERRQVYRTLRSVRTFELAPGSLRRHQLASPFTERVVVPLLRHVGRLTRRLTPAGVADRLAKELVYAGSPAGWDAERVVALKLVGVPLLALAGVGLARASGVGMLRAALLAPVLGYVGYYLPEWVLRSMAGKRQGRIQRALPDALDLLAITVEAGLAFDAAVARVARHAGGPLGEELHRVLQEMQIGRSRAEALRGLADRSTLSELKSFVLAMVQADIFGISVGRVLTIQAAEMRTKRRQRAEEKAHKVPVKITMPLILCIFPALFAVIIGPGAITIYRTIIKG